MKKITFSCFTLTAILGFTGTFAGAFAGTASAQDAKLGIDGAFVLPTGDWADYAGLGIGALVAGRYHLDPNLALTGRLGYIHHLKKEEGILEISTSEIPVLFGVKYYLDDMEGLYFGGELGYVNMRAKVKTTFMGQSVSASDSEGRFGFTAGAGYEVSNIDFRGQVFIPNMLGRKDGEDMLLGLMLNVGYRFAEF